MRIFASIRRVTDKSVLLGIGALLLSGCSSNRIEPETQYMAIEQGARVPAGVVRYCWEEPMVQLEPNGPGLDEEERWYHPSYLAVREVRQGKWRPCKPVPSEVRGETRNER